MMRNLNQTMVNTDISGGLPNNTDTSLYRSQPLKRIKSNDVLKKRVKQLLETKRESGRNIKEETEQSKEERTQTLAAESQLSSIQDSRRKRMSKIDML